MEHFARWIVKRRKLILVLAVLLLIPSVFGALGTYINYDILTYLPKDLDSMIGETYLEDDFNMASVSMITVEARWTVRGDSPNSWAMVLIPGQQMPEASARSRR